MRRWLVKESDASASAAISTFDEAASFRRVRVNLGRAIPGGEGRRVPPCLDAHDGA